MSWTVYCHTHVESGRRYIGITRQTWQKRWKNHISAAKSAKGGRWHFPNAIRKYGPEAFSHEILAICNTLEEANRIECSKIEEFKTRDPRFGFNLAEGGQHVPHPIRKNPWDDHNFRENAVARSQKLMADPAIRAKISATMKAHYSNESYTAAAAERTKKVWAAPEYRSKVSTAVKQRWDRPGERDKYRKLWEDPDFQARCSIGLKVMNTRRTHCKNGHELIDGNVRVDKRGRRECRLCCNARARTNYAKRYCVT